MLFSSKKVETKLMDSRRPACDSKAKHLLCLQLFTIAIRLRDDTERERQSGGNVWRHGGGGRVGQWVGETQGTIGGGTVGQWVGETQGIIGGGTGE